MTADLPRLPWRTDASPTYAPPRSEFLSGLRFAFYGRVSTEDNQDPEASRQWQRNRAEALIVASGGRIEVEYFDLGRSRALPWKRRPRAAELLSALADEDRQFDAVVIGEPQRAFYGEQFGTTFPLFVHYGIPLWVPEVGGAIDPDNEAHDLIMGVFGGMSKGERNRIRVRVHAAMASQTLTEGRYLGGRPPYGYRLADLGPHPHPSKANDGKRLHGLEPDPTTAPIVVRIFTEFLTGRGIFAIAEGLTRDGNPSPSAHDRQRNPHREGRAWSKFAVRAILTNPRYTGHQVWNRQSKRERLLNVEDVTLGYTTAMRWNAENKWIVSQQIVHAPLVDNDTFARVQEIFRSRQRTSPAHGVKTTRNVYQLRGTLTCSACRRKMQGHVSHGQTYYRCRYPDQYALADRIQHPRNVYLREAWVTPPLDEWIARIFAPHRCDDTINALAAAHTTATGSNEHAAHARTAIAECDKRLATHRAALEAGADPAIVTAWMKETAAAKAIAERELHRVQARQRATLSRDDIAHLVQAHRDLAATLRNTHPGQKADLYRTLGLALTYDVSKHEVLVEMHLDQDLISQARGLSVGVRGGT